MSETNPIDIPKEPLRVPSLEVMVDGARCTIFGITHLEKMRSRNQKLFAEENSRDLEADRAPLWLCETSLADFLPKEMKSLEMLDHSVGINRYYALTGLLHGLVIPLLAISYTFHYPFRLASDLLEKAQGISPKNKVSGKEQEEDKQFLRTLEINKELIYNPPLDIDESFIMEAAAIWPRSLYQAEFIRNYRPGEDKKVVVGISHVNRIALFLENPGYSLVNSSAGLSMERSQEIADLAREHAKYAQRYDKMYPHLRKEMVKKLSIPYSRGRKVGSLLWGCAITGLAAIGYNSCSGN